jgi:carbon monoxide dehydrogenase subunit G
MTRIEASAVIDRPAEVVWAYAKDIRRWPEWQSGLRDIEVTSEDPIGVHTAYRSVAQVIGRRVESDAEITAFEPPSRWCVQNTSGPYPFEACLTLEAVDGGTRVTYFAEAGAGGFFKLAEPLVARQARRTFQASLNNLKDILTAHG